MRDNLGVVWPITLSGTSKTVLEMHRMLPKDQYTTIGRSRREL